MKEGNTKKAICFEKEVCFCPRPCHAIYTGTGLITEVKQIAIITLECKMGWGWRKGPLGLKISFFTCHVKTPKYILFFSQSISKIKNLLALELLAIFI